MDLMKNETIFKLFGAWSLVVVLLNLAIVGVAIHFITKYW